ncbi:MAG: DUF2066 domain-containing protein [Candidatus Azotimanducaceae bacterium]
MVKTLLCMLTLNLLPVAWGASDSELYLIELEVDSQSPVARDLVAQEALIELLTKVTGLRNIPRSRKITEALNNPSAYYSGFSYKSNNDDSGFLINYDFDKYLVLDLVGEAKLPYWWSARPGIIIWLALDHSSQEILSSSDSHSFVRHLRERAMARGIKAELPIMDVQDQRLISYKGLISGIAHQIDQASTRYAADIYLVGKVREMEFSMDEPFFEGRWEFWFDNEFLAADFKSMTAREAAKYGIDFVVDAVVANDAVFALEQQEYQWVVAGIDSVEEYIRLKNIFEDLEFIDKFFLEKLSVSQVTFNISTRASEKKIVELLSKRKVLVENPFYRGPGLGFQIGEGFN